jgi:hypothetical protein
MLILVLSKGEVPSSKVDAKRLLSQLLALISRARPEARLFRRRQLHQTKNERDETVKGKALKLKAVNGVMIVA